MTSYSAMAARGRAAAAEVNKQKMVTVAEFRIKTYPPQGVWGYERKVGELVGDCGHVVKFVSASAAWAETYIGKRKRCSQCPIPEPKPLPEDHCEYEWENEWGEGRTCRTRGRFSGEPMGYARLCKKHHDHLLREGYFDEPQPRLDSRVDPG